MSIPIRILLAKEISPFEPAEFWQSPVFTSVAAGFHSPADDYLEKAFNLQELLVQHPIATFFVCVQGQSMLGAGQFYRFSVEMQTWTYTPVPDRARLWW